MRTEIEVEKRGQAGKGVSRQLRRSGKIPAVLYGNGTSTLLSLDRQRARKVVLSMAGQTGLVTVRITNGEAKEERIALLQDYQVDPMTGSILHVDFFEVSMEKPIRVTVPVKVVGQIPLGVKDGGILHQPLRELYVECLPDHIPEVIEVDASGLQIGQGIRIGAMGLASGIKVLEETNAMVVNVAAKVSEAKLEALMTREAAEGTPATESGEPAKSKPEVSAASGPTDSKGKEGKK